MSRSFIGSSNAILNWPAKAGFSVFVTALVPLTFLHFFDVRTCKPHDGARNNVSETAQ
jgi:hypothetical protein